MTLAELRARLHQRMSVLSRFRCPQDPSHGHLLSWSGQPAGFDWYCPHFAHRGNPFYSQAQAEATA